MRSQEFWDFFESKRELLTGRADTFAITFEYLDRIDRPIGIIETGCVRRDDSWVGDGASTLLFDRYAETHPGAMVYTVDISPEATAACRRLVSDRINIHTGDSVEFLKGFVPPADFVLDLLYLDSFDLIRSFPIPSALHHLNELMAAMPMVRDETLVVVDDSPSLVDHSISPRIKVEGKGLFVGQHAQWVGATMLFCQYQCGWLNMALAPADQLETLEQKVDAARRFVDVAQNANADSLYWLILIQTTPPKNAIEMVAHGEACLFYARLSLSGQRYGAAADWYRQALASDPRAVEYRVEYVVRTLLPMGNLRLAKQELKKALLIDPECCEAWHAMGGLEHELGNVAGCVAAYDRYMELAPGSADAILDRVTIALDTGDNDLSEQLLATIPSDDPRYADVIHCMGMVKYRRGLHEEAIELYDRAIAMDCYDPPTAHWNKSLALHSLGRYREGWQEHEWREKQKYKAALSLPMTRFGLPLWRGEPGPALIHVHYEAGAGDNLCMARYLGVLLDQGYQVRYETEPEMVSLMARSFPEVEVVPKALDYPGAIGIKPFDYHVPVGSLPNVLQTDLDTVPWPGPYLVPDPDLVEHYRKLLGSDPVMKIGICWSSGIRDGVWIKEYGLRKSMSLAQMFPIMQGSPHRFVSLQVGPERAEARAFHNVLDVLPERPTWDDTAALIANLDLVITVDTSISHLAGAMGMPVWVLMHTEGSWHWMAERPNSPWNERSPWYPSARLFRQQEPHQWDGVISDIRAALGAPG